MRVYYLLCEAEKTDSLSEFYGYDGKYTRFGSDSVVLGAVEKIEDANGSIGTILDGRRVTAITEENSYEDFGTCKVDKAMHRPSVIYPGDFDACSRAIKYGITCSQCKEWVTIGVRYGDNVIR